MKSPLTISLLFGIAFAAPLLAHPGHAEPQDADRARSRVVAVEYSDFQCTPCAEVSELLERLVNAKKIPIQVLFKHAPAHPDALLAHEAALAAGQQGKFWEMHDVLFANPKANYSEILEMAESLKLDLKRFQQAIDERELRGEVMDDIAEARGIGIRVTPTVFLNGRKLEGIDQIRAFVETVINSPEDKIDPNKVYEFELAGSPSYGPEEAPVTIVEFSDFRCGFCGEHSRTVTELVAAYPGKIRRVFKHFPIQVSVEGKLPHYGSMAALQQGKFWDMYRALMNQPLTGQDDLISRAVAIGLDIERFQRDLAANEGVAIVQRDIDEGDRHGIRVTPTTFINGKMLGGRQTFETLKMHVDRILDSNSTAPESGPVTPFDDSEFGPDGSAVLMSSGETNETGCETVR